MNITKFFLILIIFIVLLGFILRFFLKEQYPYEKCESVVTETEKQFLFVLLSIIKENYYILTKVRLADVVKVQTGTKEYSKYSSIIQSKSLDFVIVSLDNFEPLLAIELDDPSYLRDDAIERDEVNDEVLNAAGLPIIRVKTEKKYDVNKIRDDIFQFL